MNHPAVTEVRKAILEVAGGVGDVCPYRVFDNPLVQDVVSLYGGFDSGVVWARLDPNRIPHRLGEALAAYDQAVRRCRNERHERDLQNLRTANDEPPVKSGRRGSRV